MKKRIFVLVLSLVLVFNTSSAIAQPVTPEDVGIPDRYSVTAVTYYWVTQNDIDNAVNQSSWICMSVSAAIGAKLGNWLGAGVAVYFGNWVGSKLGDALRSSMEQGYYYHHTYQTYNHIGNNVWYWQYGGATIQNQSTGNYYFYNSIAPPDMYAYNLI